MSIYSDTDWKSLDWDKSNLRLSMELGIPAAYISVARQVAGRPKMGGRGNINWRELDWSKNDQQLAFETGTLPHTVRHYRRKIRGPSANGELHKAKLFTDEYVASIDWKNTRDITIARECHCSREYVRQIRLSRRLPVCQLNSVDTETMKFEKWISDNREQIAGKLASVVADFCPIVLSKCRKFQLMKKSQVQFIWQQPRKATHLKLPINWELPNIAIEAVWDKCCYWAGNTRCKYSISKPKFNICGGRGKDNPALKSAIECELEKAISIGVSPRFENLAEFGIVAPMQEAVA